MMPGRGAYPPNTIDYRPLLRAAFANLHAWVVDGTEPPASCHPSLADGTLVEPDAIRPVYTPMPGPGMPLHLLPNAAVDFGPTAHQTGVPERVPPGLDKPLPILVPAVDEDGNEIGGIRHPDLAVPLATYTGWNPRHPELGGEDQPLRATGSTIVFPRTKAQRETSGDSRVSIEERYGSEDEFLSQVRRKAEALVASRLLLDEDVEGVVAYSRQRYQEFTAGT
jgi:hypothetical protein